jgi:transcriptional regulator with PAS, ATPase and Fis domain
MIADDWVKEFQCAINVCDKEGNLLALNDKAVLLFEKDGGEKLIGTNIIDCHPEPERSMFKNMLNEGKVNCYILEKKDVSKFIYQAPWYKDSTYMGYVEFIIDIPSEVPIKNSK